MDFLLYISKILEPLGIEAFHLIRPKSFPGISYHIFNEDGELYGDGAEITTGGKLQIDLFARKSSEIRPIRKKIIEAFKVSDKVIFLKSTPDETNFEDDVKLYHLVIVFNFYYSEESEVI